MVAEAVEEAASLPVFGTEAAESDDVAKEGSVDSAGVEAEWQDEGDAVPRVVKVLHRRGSKGERVVWTLTEDRQVSF